MKHNIKELLENGAVDLFIGYEEGIRGPRPFFAASADEAANLIFNDKCTGNLAVYLTRKDLIGDKKVGISASYHALKSIVQLHVENQIREDRLLIFGLVEGELKQFENMEEIRQFLKTAIPLQKPTDDELIKRIDGMTLNERRAFWTSELSPCFKCYACRSACPMCYCTKCIVEENQPQWIDPWPETMSNIEWQISRVMHLAGRCSDCGACGTACPLGLPIHILTRKMNELVKGNFGDLEDEKGNVLATFKPEDKENFIL